MAKLPPIAGPVYFVTFTDWSGDAVSFVQSMIERHTSSADGAEEVHVPLFTSSDRAEVYANNATTQQPGVVYRVSSVDYPHSLLKVLNGFLRRDYITRFSHNPTWDGDDIPSVFEIAELRDAVLADA